MSPSNPVSTVRDVRHRGDVAVRPRVLTICGFGLRNAAGAIGGLVLGQTLGGAIASEWGVVAPFWFAFVGSGLTLLTLWRQLGSVVVKPHA